MGVEERNKQVKVALGKFNVHVKILYTDGSEEEMDVKSWVDPGNKLALEHFDGSLTVVCLDNVFKFRISPMKEDLIPPKIVA